MNLHKLILTENACYKAGRKIAVKGIMVHSTGAINPWLKRYVGPDDGLLGVNQYGNHWNTYHPGDREVCVHAFIGKLKDGNVATYQTLPWDHRGWHAGGSANNTHIGFEICEDGLNDAAYFNKVYQEAIDLCVYLCKQYGLTEKNIICHCEGYKQGVASNHGDVLHWWPKHGKNMDTFRAAVKAELEKGSKPVTPEEPKPEVPSTDLKLGDKVKMAAGAPVYGKTYKFQSWVYDRELFVRAISGDKITVSIYATGDITGTVDKKYLTKIGTAAPAQEYTTYTVVKGDTLWGIAAKLLGSGARYTEIVKLNGMKTSVIHTGDQLKIPKK